MNLLDFLGGEDAKKRQLERVFQGREPLDDDALWNRYFKNGGVTVNTVARVRGVLSRVLRVDLSRIRDTDDFSKNFAFFWDLDSLDDVEAVMAMEEEFGIKISDAEAEAMKTIRDIVLGVHKKIQSRKG